MNDFTFYIPTRIQFGNGVYLQAGKMLKMYNATCVMLHYGSQRIVKSGLLKQIQDVIEKEGIKTVLFGGVTSNPKFALAMEGVKVAKENNVDFILAIGGGSAIDSAKCIGYGVVNEGDTWDFYAGKRTAVGCLPLGVILTNAAAGSEMGQGSVVTNEKLGYKKSYRSEFALLKFALEDPTLSTSLPAYQTASGTFDAAMHTVERYFTGGDHCALTDEISFAIVRTIIAQTKIVLKDPKNLDARGNLMWASSLSHNMLTQSGNSDGGDWACHNMELELGAMFDCPHGAGISAIWEQWALYVYKENPASFQRFGNQLFGLPVTENTDADALKAIDTFNNYIKEIGMPTDIPTLLGKKITDEQIKKLAAQCSGNDSHTTGSFKKLTATDMEKIFHAAN